MARAEEGIVMADCDHKGKLYDYTETDQALLFGMLPRPLGYRVLHAAECLGCGWLRIVRQPLGARKQENADYSSRSAAIAGEAPQVSDRKPGTVGSAEIRFG